MIAHEEEAWFRKPGFFIQWLSLRVVQVSRLTTGRVLGSNPLIAHEEEAWFGKPGFFI
ncbi:MAG: hypothetical protein KDC59_12875 [Saprospiraceae bacterium]|nr:hypothetical protein [Saprospiraceae bacterium]HPG07115.1 hypothetical protein [Saprospiraceae bacterium]